MSLRQHILDVIGEEYSHLRGKALVNKFQEITTFKGEQTGREIKNEFLWGLYSNGNMSKELICTNILPILHNVPEDQKMSLEIGVIKAGDSIIRYTPLGSPRVAYPEDNVITKMYLKLEGYYDIKLKEK